MKVYGVVKGKNLNDLNNIKMFFLGLYRYDSSGYCRGKNFFKMLCFVNFFVILFFLQFM